MTNTIYHLSTCMTCKRILDELENIERFVMIDVKKTPVTEEQLDQIKSLSGLTYNELINKRSRKWKVLDEKPDSENAAKALILSHYTYLIRPIIIFNNEVYAGNSKLVVESALQHVNK